MFGPANVHLGTKESGSLRSLREPKELSSRIPTSGRPRIPGPGAVKSSRVEERKDRMSRRLDHRTQEKPKVRHTATWRRKGIREWNTEATLRRSARAGLPATRIEGL